MILLKYSWVSANLLLHHKLCLAIPAMVNLWKIEHRVALGLLIRKANTSFRSSSHQSASATTQSKTRPKNRSLSWITACSMYRGSTSIDLFDEYTRVHVHVRDLPWSKVVFDQRTQNTSENLGSMSLRCYRSARHAQFLMPSALATQHLDVSISSPDVNKRVDRCATLNAWFIKRSQLTFSRRCLERESRGRRIMIVNLWCLDMIALTVLRWLTSEAYDITATLRCER